MAVEQDTGTAVDDMEGAAASAPPLSERDAAGGSEPSLHDILSSAIDAMVQGAPTDDEEDGQDDGELEPPPTRDEDPGVSEGAEDDGEEPEPDEQAVLQQHVLAIHENPNNIARVPAAMRGRVIEAYAAQLNSTALSAMNEYKARLEQSQAEREAALFQLVSKVIEADLKRADDPEAFQEWEDQNPEQAEAYWAFKRMLRVGGRVDLGGASTQENGHGQAAQQAVDGYAKRAEMLFHRLDGYPAQQQKLVQSWQYTADEQGIAKLEADVIELLAEARAEERLRKSEPARKAATTRQEAAAHRRALPRTGDVAGRSGAPDEIDRAWEEGPRALIRAAVGRMNN